jgi:dTDP-D-glucose 4,6-dehydratase
MAVTWADISKARKMLGWSPQTDFREGMKQLAAWYEENRAWAREIDTD